MPENKQKPNLLPLVIKYSDKLKLVQQYLKFYSALIEPMTPRNIDLLTICILADMNSDKFKDTVLKSKLGFNNTRHIDTEMGRLKKAGFIDKHDKAPRWRLSSRLEAIKNNLTTEVQELKITFVRS